jgi:light-regulated signal transduction histidine kinase (bacteriophytochrome)
MFDRDMKYIVASRRYLKDYELGDRDLVGLSHYEVFPDLPQHWIDTHRRSLAGAVESSPEDQFHRSDGRLEWVRWEIHPWNDPEGRIGGLILFSEVITDRKEAEIKLRQNKDQIRRLNAELEQRVIERTAQLEAANKELEAFSYSVSHDLRAPLRGVNGFVRILQEDYAPRLDAEGNRLLNVVAGEASRMSRLIDDLLAFSRLSRQKMECERVDMTKLVKTEFESQTSSSAAPAPQFDLQELPPAFGDRALLRQVFANLIGNAIKFSRHQPAPVIEVGGSILDGEPSYYVKDNGAGFDEKYRHKLFGVFQRLHSEAEFEGTGVGLALVQRIVQRHGGQVRAEGKPGQGATFSFNLATQKKEQNEPGNPGGNPAG